MAGGVTATRKTQPDNTIREKNPNKNPTKETDFLCMFNSPFEDARDDRRVRFSRVFREEGFPKSRPIPLFILYYRTGYDICEIAPGEIRPLAYHDPKFTDKFIMIVTQSE